MTLYYVCKTIAYTQINLTNDLKSKSPRLDFTRVRFGNWFFQGQATHPPTEAEGLQEWKLFHLCSFRLFLEKQSTQ